MKQILSVVFILSCLVLIAQTDTSIFRNISTVQTNEYTFSVPEKWHNVPQIEASSRDQKFEFTDVALPHIVNNAPLTATFVLRRLECEHAGVAKNFITTEFSSYPDRIMPAGQDYLTDSVKIASGETAELITIHYYRRSKVSNFTRYDLIAYSEKRKAAYMLTVTYQYKDPTYAIEFNLKFKEYAVRVFRTLSLR